MSVSAVVGVATAELEVDEGAALLELAAEELEFEVEEELGSAELDDENELEWCVEDELGGGV